MKRIRFAMIFHCYQPVFNFEEELEKAYNNAYLPLISTLKDFKGIKTCFHFSGNILEWLENNHPDYIESVEKLVSSGNIELLTGAYSEPIMSMIPEHDRRGQITLNKSIVKRLFNVSPSGAWVPERVWDPRLISTLSREKIKYTIVDDHHFFRAGFRKQLICKPCRVHNSEDSIVLFAGHSFLRYAMPFRKPSETIKYLRKTLDESVSKDVCCFFADDGEKFGAWPYTFRHVHKKGWLLSFLKELENNSDWIKTSTCSEILNEVPVEDFRGEMPRSSYKEMMDWANGDFNNFLKKYPESGRMYNRMVRVSESIENSREDLDRDQLSRAKKELFKAQSNCAYWHGAFGGVYLPHLRSGVYEHLLKAQDILGRSPNEKGLHLSVLEGGEGSNNKEIIMSNVFLDLYFDPDNGGRLCELDHKRKKVNLLNTISRCRERYHKKLNFGYFAKIKRARINLQKGEEADIHDILGVHQRGLKRSLNYDNYRRDSFLTHIFNKRNFWPELEKTRGSTDDFLKEKYDSRVVTGNNQIRQIFSRRANANLKGIGARDIEVVKEVEISNNPVILFSQKTIDHSGLSAELGVACEFNFLIWDKRFMFRKRHIRSNRIHLQDRYSGTELDFIFKDTYHVFSYPVYSINETERGLCRTFQGISMVISKDFLEKNVKNEYMLHFSLTIR